MIAVPLVLIFLMRKGTIGGSPMIPDRRSTPNCNSDSHWCTCPNGDSWQMGAKSTCEDCEVECYDRMGGLGGFVEQVQITGYNENGFTGPKPFSGKNLIQGTLQFPVSDKVAIPIIGESMNWDSGELSNKFAHGICKCSDYNCCYKAPYQSGRGDIRTDKTCNPVHNGDKVLSCDNAFLNWQDDMFESGIDSNGWINRKISDKKFFYPLGDGESHNRHSKSGRYKPTEYAYMATAAHRPYNQRPFTAMTYNSIFKNKRHALKQILREKQSSKLLKYGRMSRKMS
jgi:hypothetical protein